MKFKTACDFPGVTRYKQDQVLCFRAETYWPCRTGWIKSWHKKSSLFRVLKYSLISQLL